jgi:hypothetical protein
MGFSFGNLLKPLENLVHKAPAAQATPAPTPTGEAAGHAGASTATAQGAAQVGATGLGAQDHSGPALNATWNHLMGGPGNGPSNDGRGLDVNHIGNRLGGGPAAEGGAVSNLMRNTPYLGDYWEALSVTHDSRHIQNNLLNGASAVTNVGLTGPLMGLVDAPFRMFGHSLFLNNDDKK